MQQGIAFLATLMFLCIGNLSFAQELVAKSGELVAQSSKSLQQQEQLNWSVFADEENKVYYIDFESLKVNLSKIVIRNDKGAVLFKEDVFDLPVDTIYELDFSSFGAGKYDIELQSFTDIIKKSVTITE